MIFFAFHVSFAFSRIYRDVETFLFEELQCNGVSPDMLINFNALNYYYLYDFTNLLFWHKGKQTGVEIACQYVCK